MTLPLCGLAVDRRLELLNGPALVVRGRRRYSPPPTLFSTAVRGELDLTPARLASHLLLPGRRLVRRSTVLGGLSRAQFDYLGHEERRYGEQAAIYAACELLGLPVRLTGHGARVLGVATGGPAEDVLHLGDVLIAVDGTDVHTALQVATALRISNRGLTSCLVLRADRTGAYGDGAPREIKIQMPAKNVADAPAQLGLRLTTHRPALSLPVDLDVDLDPDGAGPSAGLMLALAVLDVLTPGSLTGGRRVAGTGTIGVDGAVGTVDWVEFKAKSALRAGADIFLAPSGSIPHATVGSPEKLCVVGVDTLSEAVGALVAIGGSPPLLAATK